MNTNYFFNQIMGVNSLEKLHKTKFHYMLDMILNQRTRGMVLLEDYTCWGGRGQCSVPQERGLNCRLAFRLDDLGASS